MRRSQKQSMKNPDTKSAAASFRKAIARVKKRREEISSELRELDGTLAVYGIDPRLLEPGNGESGKQTRTLAQPGAGEDKKKRRRRPSPPVEWLRKFLQEGKKQQVEIMRASTRAGYSERGAVKILKAHPDKFKSQRGARQPHQRGSPPPIWSLRT